LHQPLLLRIERDDSDGQVVSLRVPEALDGLGYECLGFDLVGARPSSGIDTVHAAEGDGRIACIRRGICDQRAFVIGMVREADEALMSAAIVTGQPMMW